MSGLTQDGALAAAPFFVEERLEEALERALEIAPGIELCLEVHPEVPELVVGLGERLRDRGDGARACVRDQHTDRGRSRTHRGHHRRG